MKFGFNKGLTLTQKKALAITLTLALLSDKIPIFSYISDAYTTGIHEVGHAFTGWIFGYVAIPSFDFMNGGGVTKLFSRPFLLGFVGFIFVYANLLLIKKHLNFKSNFPIGFIMLVYCIFFFSELHLSLVTFMGLGGEILFSFIIAWHALSNLMYKLSIKYTIHLFLSMVIIQHTSNFLYSLLYNPQLKSKYLEGKQQILENNTLINDLTKLVEKTGLPLDFFSWVLIFLTALSIYYILRINKLPRLSGHFFKRYFTLLWNILKEQKSQIIKVIKNQ